MSTGLVKLYTTQFCGYCRAAKSLLQRENIPFETIDLTHQPDELHKLKAKTQHMTVPLIFLNDTLIGGFQELRAFIQKNGASALMPPKD